MLGFLRLLVFALTMSFIAAPVFAQRDRDTWSASSAGFEVSGQVRLADSSEPARNVPVRLERFSGGVVDQITTDNQGRFRFPGLQRGYYTVVINVPGYSPAQQPADLQVLFKAFLVFDLTNDKSRNTSGVASSPDVVDARVPADAREEFVRGRTALVKRGQLEAIAHLQKAIFLYPEFLEAHLLLGTSYMDLREWEKAESALRRAWEIKSDNSTVLSSLGEVYWREKRYDDAEKTLLDGLKLDDRSWHGYFTLGRLYWEIGEVKKAGRAVGRTLQLRPEFAEAHLLAGNILLRLSQQDRALVEYQEYLRLEPKGDFAPQTRELVQKLGKVVAEKKPSN
jgi:Flp pilus assembly protein TadD